MEEIREKRIKKMLRILSEHFVISINYDALEQLKNGRPE